MEGGNTVPRKLFLQKVTKVVSDLATRHPTVSPSPSLPSFPSVKIYPVGATGPSLVNFCKPL